MGFVPLKSQNFHRSLFWLLFAEVPRMGCIVSVRVTKLLLTLEKKFHVNTLCICFLNRFPFHITRQLSRGWCISDFWIVVALTSKSWCCIVCISQVWATLRSSFCHFSPSFPILRNGCKAEKAAGFCHAVGISLTHKTLWTNFIAIEQAFLQCISLALFAFLYCLQY